LWIGAILIVASRIRMQEGFSIGASPQRKATDAKIGGLS
jgi:hypothetical protein